MVESSFALIYAISVNNGAIDRIPTTNIPAINENTLANQDFWWLIGYLQGDGSVDLRNGIWFHSTDRELIDAAKSLVSSLFRLSSSIYLEKPKPHRKPRLRLAVYSRTLVRWLFKQKLNFGTQRWTVPKLSKNLFCPYIAGSSMLRGKLFWHRVGGFQSSYFIVRMGLPYESLNTGWASLVWNVSYAPEIASVSRASTINSKLGKAKISYVSSGPLQDIVVLQGRNST